MNGFWPSIVAIATAIVGLAVVAVVLSKNSDTRGVVGTAFGGFSDSIRAAVSPVTSASGGYQLGSMFDLSGAMSGLSPAHL